MRISETLELSIRDDIDINKLEGYLAREIKRLGSRCLAGYSRRLKRRNWRRQRAGWGAVRKLSGTCSPAWD